VRKPSDCLLCSQLSLTGLEQALDRILDFTVHCKSSFSSKNTHVSPYPHPLRFGSFCSFDASTTSLNTYRLDLTCSLQAKDAHTQPTID
jgi:hypothetical protein